METINWGMVRSIASEARQWAEAYARKYSASYGPDLCCLCAKASGRLHSLFKRYGVPGVIAANDNHVFNVVGDYVVDITATQFDENNKKVVILPRKLATNFYWKIDIMYDEVANFCGWQESGGWPDYQKVKLDELMQERVA